MKVIDGEEVFGIEDVKFVEEPQCEHCGVLESFSAVLDDEWTHWCMDCTEYQNNFKVSDEEKKQIKLKELTHKINHFKGRVAELEEEMITVNTGIPLE